MKFRNHRQLKKKIYKNQKGGIIIKIEALIKEEIRWRGEYFQADKMRKIVENYQFTEGETYWKGTKHIRKIPAVWSRQPRILENSKTDLQINFLFDHCYTLKTKDGKVVWATCPYSHGFSADWVRNVLAVNQIFPIAVIDTEDTPYGDFMILFDPANVVAAYAK